MRSSEPRRWHRRGGRRVAGLLLASFVALLMVSGCGSIPDDGEPVPVHEKTPPGSTAETRSFGR